jgi:hypothetical protein
MTLAIILLFWAALIGLAVYLNDRGKPTYVTLLEYQRGVLYRRGVPVREVGCGKHRVWTGTELLVHADTRPISISFENQVVALQDGNSALYGILASAQIRDIRKVIASARDYNHVPPAVLLRCARLHLNACSQSSLALNKEAVVNKITQDAKTRLHAAGFELISFRLSQLAIGTAKKQDEPAKKEASTLA